MWLLALLLALPLVAASPLDVLGGVWDRILSIGNLSFVHGQLVGLTRILIAILCFTLFFAVLLILPANKDGTPRFKRNHAIVIAAVLAIISAVFLPANAILAVGAGWATAVGLILIGAPILGLGYLLWNIPEKGQPDTRGTVLFKLLLSMLLFWILSAMNSEVRVVGTDSATVAGTMANFIAWGLYITSIMIIYYIVKFFMVGGNDEDAEKRWQESGQALGKWIGKKMDAQKAREEMERRAKEINEPKSYLINALENCDGIVNAFRRGARTPEERKAVVDKAESELKQLKKYLKKAVRSLRYIRRKMRGPLFESFDNSYSYTGVALARARSISLPKPDSESWDAEVKNIVELLRGPQGVRTVCGAIINYLDKFIEHNQQQISYAEAAQRAEQQAQQRAQQQEQRQEAAKQKTQEQAAQKLEGRTLEGQKLEGRTLGRRTRLEPRGAVKRNRPQKK